MLFYSTIFLFFFMPILLVVYYYSNNKLKDLILLFASFFFYFWGEPRFVFIALFSSLVDYIIAKQIYKNLSHKKAKNYTGLGIVLNLIVLFYFKYVDFFINSLNTTLGYFHFHDIALLKVALPIGVSFIIFEKITYLVDIYRGKTEPANSLAHYLLYIFLFPKLLAGPIVKYHDIASQLKNRSLNLENFLIGFKRFLIGLIKKILLADTLGEVTSSIFALPLDQISFTSAWLGVIFFTLQIYLDFSAYSDMAIGLARIFGFKIPENFNYPYLSLNFTDFWRRWHISLSSWIKEYLYLPLGGNQCRPSRIYLNLSICFLISGLWHGAKWTYVIWGIYNGLFLILDKLFWIKVSKTIPQAFNIIITLFFVMIGWMIFRCDSLAQAGAFYSALFNPSKTGVYLYITDNVWFALFFSIIVSLAPVKAWYRKALIYWEPLKFFSFIYQWVISALSLLTMSRILVSTFNPFLYFRF